MASAASDERLRLIAGERCSSCLFFASRRKLTKEERDTCTSYIKGTFRYAVAPNRTDTNFETPGSCIVTPYRTGAMLIVFLL
jgi:hypothetical protein